MDTGVAGFIFVVVQKLGEAFMPSGVFYTQTCWISTSKNYI